MSEYIKTVIITVLSVSVISCLFPKNSFGKFANIIASIIVMAVLLMPVAKLGGGNFNFDTLPEDLPTNSENIYLKSEFEQELAHKLKQELYEKTGKEFSVEIKASVTQESVSIEKAKIFPYTTEYAEICASYLGIEEDRVVQK